MMAAPRPRTGARNPTSMAESDTKHSSSSATDVTVWLTEKDGLANLRLGCEEGRGGAVSWGTEG